MREAPLPGQPGAPRTVIATPGPGSGPIRHVSLAEACQMVPFPVDLPQSVPSGFTLADVTVFQPDPGIPPSQVFVIYQRPGAYQPRSRSPIRRQAAARSARRRARRGR